MLVWKDGHLQAWQNLVHRLLRPARQKAQRSGWAEQTIREQVLAKGKNRLPKIDFWMSKKAKSKV